LENRNKYILYHFPLLFLAFLSIFVLFKFIFIFFFKAAFEPSFIFELTPAFLISGMGYEHVLFLSLVVVVLNTYLHLNATIKNIKYSILLTLCMVGGIGLGFLTKDISIATAPNVALFGLFLLTIVLDHRRTLEYPESLPSKPSPKPARMALPGRRPKVSASRASSILMRLPRLKRGGAPGARKPPVRGKRHAMPRRGPGQPINRQGVPPGYRPRSGPPQGQPPQPNAPPTGGRRGIAYSGGGGGGGSHAISQGGAREGAMPIGTGPGGSPVGTTTASSWDKERPTEPTRNIVVAPGEKEGAAHGKSTRYVEKKVYVEGPTGVEQRTIRVPVAPEDITQPIEGGEKIIREKTIVEKPQQEPYEKVQTTEEVTDTEGKKVIVTKEVPVPMPAPETSETLKEEAEGGMQPDTIKKGQIVIPEVQSYFERVQNGLEALAKTIEALFQKIQYPGQNIVATPEVATDKTWIKTESIGEYRQPTYAAGGFTGGKPMNIAANYPSYTINAKRNKSIKRAQNILDKLEHKVENLEKLYDIY
jgi:hypothetical protein